MPNYEYQVGGSLGSDAPSYIVRQADSELYQALVDGNFCYVFNSRQMGKSSLRVRTKDALEVAGFTCVSIDMTSIGSQNITPYQWYKGVAAQMWRGLNLIGKVNFKKWWEEQNDLAPLQCLGLFIEEVILTQVTGEKIFIFIDEIDSVLSLDFQVDDFFALIRQCYNQRDKNSPYNRLGFALFGVTTPSDLIYDRTRTPFNIGRAIELRGFQVHEALSLTRGLEDKFSNPQAVLQEIIYWTGGQPFLTQKLCQIALVECRADRSCMMPGEEVNWIEQLVRKHIIIDWQAKDEPEHLKTIRDRLIRDEQKAGRVLGRYQNILRQDRLIPDDTPEQIELLLSGLIEKKGCQLKIRNPIYREVFSLDWVKQQLDSLRPYAKALNAWQKSLGQDKSRLLRGKALQDAQEWAENHSLSEQDYQFLAASQDLEQQEKQRILEIEKLREVEARLAQEKKTAQQQRFYLGTLSIALVTTIALGVAAFFQYRQAAINEIRALVNSADALFISNRQFDSLIEAIQAMERSQQLQIADPQLSNSLESVLRQAVYGANEYNRLSGHIGTVHSVAFSPDGRLIATGGEDKTIKIWQADGTLLHTLKGHSARVWDVEFSPDSQTIVSASRDKTVKVWSVKGKLLNTFTGHLDAVFGVAIAPDGRTIASVSRDRTIKLWKINGRLIDSQVAHDAEVRSVAFSPDGRLIATGSDDKTAKLWQINEEGKLLTTPQQIFQGHSDEVLTVAFSPDGKLIATGGQDKTIKLWNLDGNLINTFVGHDASVTNVMFNADGTNIISSSWDQTIKLWTINGSLLQTITDNSQRIWGLALSPDGQSLATASDGSVKLWKPDNPLLNVLRGHSASVIDVIFDPQSKIITSGSDDKTIKLWDRYGGLITTVIGNQEAILGLAYSPDGKNLVSGHSDGKIKLWKISKHDRTKVIPLNTLNGHTALVWQVAYSPDGKMFASASEDSTVKLWTRSGKLIATLTDHIDGVKAVNFSPDGKILASASLDGTIKLWNRRGNVLATLRGHQAAVIDVEFSPEMNSDGSYLLASASWDSTSKLWKIESDGNSAIATLDNTLIGHNNGILGVSFSPDGKSVATASQDNSIKLWNTNGKLIKTLFGHSGSVWQVNFSSQGDTLVSSSEDKTVIIWDLERIYELDLLAYGCDWIQDYLHSNVEVKKLVESGEPALCQAKAEDAALQGQKAEGRRF